MTSLITKTSLNHQSIKSLNNYKYERVVKLNKFSPQFSEKLMSRQMSTIEQFHFHLINMSTNLLYNPLLKRKIYQSNLLTAKIDNMKMMQLLDSLLYKANIEKKLLRDQEMFIIDKI